MFQHCVATVQNANLKRRDNKLNGVLLGKLYALIGDAEASVVTVKWCLDVLIELYKKNMWYVVVVCV